MLKYNFVPERGPTMREFGEWLQLSEGMLVLADSLVSLKEWNREGQARCRGRAKKNNRTFNHNKRE